MTKKGLSLFALTMIAIGSTIGSGIFKTPTSIAQAVPDPMWMTVLWIAGGVVSMIGALVYAVSGVLPNFKNITLSQSNKTFSTKCEGSMSQCSYELISYRQ